MIHRVKARAFANIALSKYWGKASGTENRPATPSISIALAGLVTETVVAKNTKNSDSFTLNGRRPQKHEVQRMRDFLDLWRKRGLIRGHYRVSTDNDFPTASGLASSSSGFAALAMALSGISEKNLSVAELSRLARMGSGSAARSIVGGVARMPVSKNPDAQEIVSADDIDWGMVIVEVEAPEKSISSREGMQLCAETSPYYKEWLKQAKLDYRALESAIIRRDLEEVGKLTEANAMAMHACMVASRPSLLYFNDVSLRVIQEVIRWRKKGLQVYFTMDAGPHLALLSKTSNLKKIANRAAKIKGVFSAQPSLPGGPAVILEKS
ncbi:MAG: diphosphomevalonate decarboxylase [candidate division Zixibacteria bacterium]|nr:diphosphomevalonate decarboxylase [candidate division Zixibacteria bacterium]